METRATCRPFPFSYEALRRRSLTSPTRGGATGSRRSRSPLIDHHFHDDGANDHADFETAMHAAGSGHQGGHADDRRSQPSVAAASARNERTCPPALEAGPGRGRGPLPRSLTVATLGQGVAISMTSPDGASSASAAVLPGNGLQHRLQQAWSLGRRCRKDAAHVGLAVAHGDGHRRNPCRDAGTVRSTVRPYATSGSRACGLHGLVALRRGGRDDRRPHRCHWPSPVLGKKPGAGPRCSTTAAHFPLDGKSRRVVCGRRSYSRGEFTGCRLANTHRGALRTGVAPVCGPTVIVRIPVSSACLTPICHTGDRGHS